MGCTQAKPEDQYKSQKKFKKIADHYKTLDEVEQALRQSGLEACELIIGIDFTKSNTWNGKKSFKGRSLHTIDSDIVNPYEDAIQIIAKTLKSFDDDNLIPCFGFGDLSTQANDVFSLFPHNHPANGVEELVSRYRDLAQSIGRDKGLTLAGPTSFAPLIREAIDVVINNNYRYHILLIIADGQVTQGELPDTIQAIVDASHYPLSIVMVGVGDGPWGSMEYFDDEIPQRRFDNFQFVNFTELSMKAPPGSKKREALFAVSALMECPIQYGMIQELGIHKRQATKTVSMPAQSPPNVLPPPDQPTQPSPSSPPPPYYGAV